MQLMSNVLSTLMWLRSNSTLSNALWALNVSKALNIDNGRLHGKYCYLLYRGSSTYDIVPALAQALDPLYLEGLSCPPNAIHLDQCSNKRWNATSCNGSNDMMITCTENGEHNMFIFPPDYIKHRKKCYVIMYTATFD